MNNTQATATATALEALQDVLDEAVRVRMVARVAKEAAVTADARAATEATWIRADEAVLTASQCHAAVMSALSHI